MRVLLVEDDELKRLRLEEHLCRLRNMDLRMAKSVRSAVDALEPEPFDLVVLDMSLPAFDLGDDEDGGNRKPFGGREILRQMEELDLATPTVVVTQFDRFGEGSRVLSLRALTAQLELLYPNYLGAVEYRTEFDGWKEDLSAKIRLALGEAGV